MRYLNTWECSLSCVLQYILLPPNVLKGFPGGSAIKNLRVTAGDAGLIPGWEGSSEEGNGSPLQYSCLGNPMDRVVWPDNSPRGCNRVGHNLATKQKRLKIKML